MTQEFADTLTKLCREKDILLICDEVQAGNGRTGTLYSYEQLGLRPDIVTTAKGIGGGLPIGICMFNEKTKNALVPGTHGTTFGGNPVACAGALSIVERLNEGFLDSVKRKSAMIFEAFRDAPGVAAVEGLGLMIAITPASKKHLTSSMNAWKTVSCASPPALRGKRFACSRRSPLRKNI